MLRDAVLSKNGKFRYTLERYWDSKKPTLGFIMLNPSTADALQDDPTIRKCIGFAERLGYGGIIVGNLFAYRSPSPKQLKYVMFMDEDIRGPMNNAYLYSLYTHCKVIIAAWGNGIKGLHDYREILESADIQNLYCLGTTLQGNPKHPCRLPYSSKLQKYKL